MANLTAVDQSRPTVRSDGSILASGAGGVEQAYKISPRSIASTGTQGVDYHSQAPRMDEAASPEEPADVRRRRQDMRVRGPRPSGRSAQSLDPPSPHKSRTLSGRSPASMIDRVSPGDAPQRTKSGPEEGHAGLQPAGGGMALGVDERAGRLAGPSSSSMGGGSLHGYAPQSPPDGPK